MGILEPGVVEYDGGHVSENICLWSRQAFVSAVFSMLEFKYLEVGMSASLSVLTSAGKIRLDQVVELEQSA